MTTPWRRRPAVQFRVFFVCDSDEPLLREFTPEHADPEVRTDMYYAVDEGVGLKERGIEEIGPAAELSSSHKFASSGPLELKLRQEIDELFFEKWKKHVVADWEAAGTKLRETGRLLFTATPQVTLRKTRRKVSLGAVDVEETRVQALEKGGAVDREWRSLAVEGKRQVARPLRQKILKLAEAHAVDDTFMTCGYPEFVLFLSEEVFTSPDQDICRHRRSTAAKRSHSVAGSIASDELGFRPTVATHCFSLVVCRHPATGKVLAVEELDGRGWWLPGGHLDAGETFAEAALRQTEEETGLRVDLKGILAVEHSLITMDSARMRLVYLAEPSPGSERTAPKILADEFSERAAWLDVDDMQQLANKGDLRGAELLSWAKFLQDGGQAAPVPLLQEEQSGPNSQLLPAMMGGAGAAAEPDADLIHALHIQDAKTRIARVRRALLAGARPDAVCPSTKAPALHVAIQANDQECVRLLLFAGAQVSSKSAEGKTALGVAHTTACHPAILDLLHVHLGDALRRSDGGEPSEGIPCLPNGFL
uniref:Nudix hydrolase domain-containing protein n=1 Tax=Rhizochromulina marina TaxID=1034831 RepID=A0A7S2SQG1_9STRA|mmetsp:Transcript_4216/g.12496  ORF Transcript_4216/g.12496 Transcript_4216/m.12496 type:complete len:535 (+) Transcript_4216:59-1663(+)